jgi:competence protein ComEC
MQFHLIPYVFLRLVVCFIGGILLAVYEPLRIPIGLVYGIGVFLLLAFIFLYGYNRIKNRNSIWVGVIILVLMVWAGYLRTIFQTVTFNDDYLGARNATIEYYQVTIIDYPLENSKSFKNYAVVNKVYADNSWSDVSGYVLLYFNKTEFKDSYLYGDVLLIKGAPQPLMPPANPGEFDYKEYLSFKQIHHQHFVKKQDIKYVGYQPEKFYMPWALKARLWADATLKAYVQGSQARAIASALILGVTNDIDQDLLLAYSATGAMHILSVSGLHVGILYMILIFLLKPIKLLKHGAWFIAGISLVVLWGYAFITGLSPSVLRSVAMFSFVAVAQPFNFRTNIYNTLGASAFFILLYDPFLIMSVGFQLSYLAVLGIVYFYPLFHRWYFPTTRLGSEIWKVTCVSFAAQVSTFSLGLLYFHQFPNYFLLSNLLVIPISFGVLVLGIFVIAISFITPIATLAGILLTWLIDLMNGIVFFVEALPFSLINHVYISTFQSWLLMLMVVMLLLLFQYRKIFGLWGFVCMVVVFCFTQWRHVTREVYVDKLTFYKVNKHTAVDFMSRGIAYFYADSTLVSMYDKIRFHITPNRIRSGIGKFISIEQAPAVQTDYGNMVLWKGNSFLFFNQKVKVLPENIRVDYLIIGKNAVTEWTHVLNHIDPRVIILDTSNSMGYAKKSVQELISKNREVYSIHDGSYTIHL